jgi:ribokinase
MALRIAVIGHAEHVTIAAAQALPAPGDILHLDHPEVIAGGGGGIAFHQLAKSDAELHFFTALGNDDAAATVRAQIEATGARIHAARRAVPHTRDLVLVTAGGERTVIVAGDPLHPQRSDDLPWQVLRSCDAAYFTGQDPDTIVQARSARVLIVTARRRDALARSGVVADVVVGSDLDPRERGTLAAYSPQPRALVMTSGAGEIRVETDGGTARVAVEPRSTPIVGSYGAGDSFAGALTWYLAGGWPVPEACRRAAVYGAAVLRGVNPIAHQMRLA